ncbi:MAG: DUF4826 family protein [Bacteroidales bacterium]|nr:DUF4826 family protein [Bacteroidales bacterium]
MNNLIMDTKKMLNANSLANSKIEFKEEILKLHKEASNYLKSQKWCNAILDSWYDRGLADKVAVFFFKIDPVKGADDYVWIIVGDIPPAYVDIESATNGACAIQVYADIMEDWIKAAREGGNMEEVFPVNIAANEKYANMLASRIQFIRERILVMYTEELGGC